MLKFGLALILLSTVASANPAGAPAAAKATAISNEEVNKACAADAKKTVNCDGKKVGAGLVSCLEAMVTGKMAFKLSPECKKALDTWNKAQASH